MSCDPFPVQWGAGCEPPTATPEQMLAATGAAQSLLWHLSGSRFGSCVAVENYRVPSSSGCGVPYKDDRGFWHNGGGRGGVCCRLLLHNRPVQRVVGVSVDGRVLDPSEYRLEGGWLQRLGACWPTVADCDPPVIRVEYVWGVPVTGPVFDDSEPPVLVERPAPYWGAVSLAMGELVVEFLHGMCGDPCKLPSRVASITRQGITVNFLTPEQWFELGLVGLPMTDSFLRAVNPNGRRARSRVYSPDLARRS